MSEDKTLDKLTRIEQMLADLLLQQKVVFNFNEACDYLDMSESHLYRLTSTRKIPHFCPQGKRLYFNRHELDQWLQRNRQNTRDEINQKAANYLIEKGRV